MPFVYYNPNPAGKYTIDCTIRTISKVMDMDWDTAYMKLAIQGFADKSMMVDDKVWGQYLRNNGFEFCSFRTLVQIATQ